MYSWLYTAVSDKNLWTCSLGNDHLRKVSDASSAIGGSMSEKLGHSTWNPEVSGSSSPLITSWSVFWWTRVPTPRPRLQISKWSSSCQLGFLPFKPWYKNAYSPHCSPYISYGTSKENLSKYQDISPLVITSFILITWVFEQAVMTKREISFSSLGSGLKGSSFLCWICI